MQLREYQADAEASVRVATGFDGFKSPLVVMATGLGKTVVFSHIGHNWPSGRVMVIAHREELINQAAAKIEAVSGDHPQVEMAARRAVADGMMIESNFVVASVQTLTSGRTCRQCNGSGVTPDGEGSTCPNCVYGKKLRLQKFDPHEFGLLVIDEAHHAPSASYRKIINYFQQNPNLTVLGVTATPDRSDEIGLGSVFDCVTFNYQLHNAIEDGWLCPVRQSWVHVEGLDFSKLKAPGGDFRESDIAKLMEQEEELHKVVTATIHEAGDKKTLIFSASVAHAEKMAEILRRHNLSAECVTGETRSEDRHRILRQYAEGKVQFLCGCGVFLEGFDEPSIELIAMARPTKSRALYAQAIGRGTRPIDPPTAATAAERRAAIAASRKPFVHVLDFVGNSGRHKLISTADILAGDEPDEIIEDAIRRAKEKGKGKVDMSEEIREAIKDRKREQEERERKLKFLKTEHIQYKLSEMNPFDVLSVWPGRDSVKGKDKGRSPTEKQLKFLDSVGIPSKTLDSLTYAQATRLIGNLMDRRKKGLCTFKQARLLKQYGYSPDTSFSEAKQILDGIFQSKPGWRPDQPKAERV